MVEHSNVVTTIAGASAGLAGLTLVFVGSLVSTLQSFEADTPPAVLTKYKLAVNVVLGTFTLGVVTIAFSVWWLTKLGDVHWLYDTVVSIFGAQLIATLATALFAVYRLVR